MANFNGGYKMSLPKRKSLVVFQIPEGDNPDDYEPFRLPDGNGFLYRDLKKFKPYKPKREPWDSMTLKEIKNRNGQGNMCMCECVTCDRDIQFLITKIERMQKAIFPHLPMGFLNEQPDLNYLPPFTEVEFRIKDLLDFFDVEVKRSNKDV